MVEKVDIQATENPVGVNDTGAALEEKHNEQEETKEENQAYKSVTIKKTPLMTNEVASGRIDSQWPSQEQLEQWLPK